VAVRKAARFRRRRLVVAGVGVVVAGMVVVALVILTAPKAAAPPLGLPCEAAAGGSTVELDLEQAQNATTIAVVGKRAGLPDHAVTIALATAMQESKLHNVDYGDRDSLGLFQQRPSQGWGTTEQVMSPEHAAGAFYDKLTAVPGWETMAVTDAAQRVQRSGAPTAYARWEDDARVLAQALTGEVPAGLKCRVVLPKGSTVDSGLTAALTAEVGAAATDPSAPPAQGWTTAMWLVGHADQLQIKTVTYAGQRWTARSGTWTPFKGADASDGLVHAA